MKVAVVQSVLPAYRAPFFGRLASRVHGLDLYFADQTPEAPALRSVAAPAGCVVHVAPTTVRSGLLWQPGMWTAAGGRYDVIVLAWNARHLLLAPAVCRARTRGVATVLWGHGQSPSENRLRRGIRNLPAAAADALVVYGPSARDRLLEDGFEPGRVFVAPNAVDTAGVDAAISAWPADRLARFREAEGLGEAPILLFVSRLDPSKDLTLLFRAFALVRGQVPTVRLVIVGDGPDRPLVQAEAARSGGAIRWLGALFEEEALAPWMLTARAMAYPTSIGLTVQHAFSYGLPMVTTGRRSAHGPEIEAVEHEGNGLLYEHGSADAFADALLRVVTDGPLRLALSRRASATVRTGPWRLDAMVDGMVAALEAAARRRGRLRPP